MKVHLPLQTSGLLLLLAGAANAQLARLNPMDPYAGSATSLRGDTNGDCVVDAQDLVEVLSDFGTSVKSSDVNGDGTVDQIDIDMVNALFGDTCGTRLWGDVDGDGIVGLQDLMQVLSDFGTGAAASDLDGDGTVGALEIELVQANWGRNLNSRVLGDVNGDDVVDNSDLILVLGYFGRFGTIADVDHSGIVDSADLDILRAQWGAVSGTDLTGDVDGDRVVGASDAELVQATWGTAWAPGDVDGSGLVDLQDLLLVNAHFGDVAGTDLSGDIDGNWIVDSVDLAIVQAVFGADFGPADIDQSGAVDFQDLNLVTASFGDTFGMQLEGDVNGDCVVGSIDQELVLAAWGSSFLPADVTGDGAIDNDDLLAVLTNSGMSCD